MSRTARQLLLAAILCAMVAPAAPAVAQTVVNPGFESVIGSEWTAVIVDGSFSVFGRSAGAAMSGSYGAHIETSDNNTATGYFTQVVTGLTVGGSYTLSAYMRHNSTFDRTDKYYGYIQAIGGGTTQTSAISTSAWAQYTLTQTANSSGQIEIRLYFYKFNTTTGKQAYVYFDDVSLTSNCTRPATPTSPAANPSSTCSGQSSTLSAAVESGCTVDWYTGSCGGTLAGSGTSLVVHPTTTTTYYPRARNTATSCESTSCGTAVTITTGGGPAAPTGPAANPSTISSGQSATLSATADSGCTVDWFTGSCGGTLVGSGTSLAVSPGGTTTYYPRARNTTSGCVSASCGSAVTLTVNVPPAELINGDFEEWAGVNVADNWTQYTTSGIIACYKGSSFTGDPSVSPHGGLECQRLKLAASGVEGGVYQRFSSVVGVDYTVSAWLLTRLTGTTQAEAKLGVDPTGATAPGASTTWSSTVGGDSSWTQKTLTVTATGSYVTVFLDGRHPTTDTGQCNAFFDDASCSAPSEPTIRYVKYHASGSYNGQSWSTAFNTVQDAVDAANADDEIWVASGIYTENIVLKTGVALYGGFSGTETTRSQRNWATNVSKLDGNWAGSVIEVAKGADSSTRIDGFTITNGQAVLGGGIYLNQNSSPVIANNAITGNSATYDGGGIFSNFGCSPVIAGNRIASNGALAGGGGVRSTTGAATLTNNLIASNSAASGGGICCGDSSTASHEYLINNTIFGNAASTAGGIYCYGLTSASISNNVIAFNAGGIAKSGSGAPSLKKNCLYGNPGYNYSGISQGSTRYTLADPQLASSVYGNLHIQSTSPCKNAGDNTEVISGYSDIDNQTRVQNTTVDIGADESDGTTYTVTPAIVRVTTTGNDSNNGSTWALAKRTIQAAISDASAGGEVWVKAGTYGEHVALRDYVYVYGGFAGTETTRSQRNWTSNVTMIDGGAAASVVEAVSMGYRVSAIDGFTLQNGKSRNGAGVLCVSAAPQVMNNTITANSAYGNGGGVYLANSAALVKANQIISNSSLGNGGGLSSAHSSAEVYRNSVEDNWACLNGCGVSVGGGSYGKLINNRIVKNHQCPTMGGAWGTGLSVDPNADPSVICNTLADNLPGSNGAIYCGVYGTLTLRSNIFAFNGSGIKGDAGSSITKTLNCVFGNSGYTGGGSDILTDPRFVDRVSGDYRIASNSPCVNAAEAATAPVDDYLGNTRSDPDIGCYEYIAGSNPAPTVTAITPSSGPSTGTTSVTNLAGTGFLTGAVVKLRRTGYSDITATGVTVVSATKITCSLALAGKKTGLWDVLVTNSDAQSATLAGGFGITVSTGSPVVGMTIDSLVDSITTAASLNRQVCVWGEVEVINSSTFWLDDGSATRIKVYAPGYSGIANGSFVSARGTADVSSSPPVLVSTSAGVVKYH